MDWNTILISAIPTLGTIITIITTTILQLRNSKRETQRLNLQLQHQRDSEKSKAEESRIAAAFAKDLEIQYAQRIKLTEYYTQMVELCCGYNEIDQQPHCIALYTIALKLLEFSRLSNDLHADVLLLIADLEERLFYNTALGPGALDILRPKIFAIGQDISALPSISATCLSTVHSETLDT